jgi:RNA polymerase sigma factor (sigma-70 family)
MNNEELMAARECQDWDALALEGARLIDLALRKVKHHSQDRDDMRQEGMTAMLTAVKTWNPEDGAFSTYVVMRMRFAMLNWLRANQSVVKVKKHGLLTLNDTSLDTAGSESDEDEVGAPLDRLTYDEDGPSEYRDPGLALQAESAPEAVATLLERLQPDDQEVLRNLYGIGRPRVSSRQLASQAGKSLGVVLRARERHIETLAQEQKKGEEGFHCVRVASPPDVCIVLHMQRAPRAIRGGATG